MTQEGTTQTQADSGYEKVFTFPQGIPGFEQYTTYTIFHINKSGVNVYWLESCDTPKVTFTLVDPTNYGLNFELQLSNEEQELLQAENYKDIAVLLMLSKKEGESGEFDTLNANIAGPIILNVKKQLGLQKVIIKSHVDVNIIQD